MKTLAADSAVSAERVLNAAIVNADITRSFEEYLTLVDQYYAEDVEVSTDVSPDPLVGKGRLKSLLLGFLLPLHMMAEMGGLWVSIHEASIPGDSLDEQHSEWFLELIGVTGRRVTQAWCADGNSRASSLNITTRTGKTARHKDAERTHRCGDSGRSKSLWSSGDEDALRDKRSDDDG